MLNDKEERYWSKYTCNYDDIQEYVVGKTVRQEIVKRLNDERDLVKFMRGDANGQLSGKDRNIRF